MFLDIHLEYCDDKGERLRSVVELGKPFAVSVVPVLLMPKHEVFRNGVYPPDYFYPSGIVALLRELAKNKNVVFGQQGFLHYCPECFKVKETHDPWHENRCLYGKRKSVGEQASFMMQGKRFIEDSLEVSPVIYAAPNHQSDKNTRIAARQLGYRYFAERAILNVAPYEDDGLIVLPERKPHQTGNIFYIHYDQIAGDMQRCVGIVNNSYPLESLELTSRYVQVFLNRELVPAWKKVRDLRKRI